MISFRLSPDFIREFNIKPRIVKVNASTTSLVRAKCRFCLKGPEKYHALKLPIKWYNPRRILDLAKVAAKHSMRMCQDFYLVDDPKTFKGILAFVGYPLYMSYDPSLHTKRGTHAIDNMVELLACHCGYTSWIFYSKNGWSRPEIDCRKARYNYPHKFEDWF